MKRERLMWIAAGLCAIAFWVWRAVISPLPFYGFQSDPELVYIDSAVLLANGHPVDHTDHPGTALQWTGAIIARATGMKLDSVFDAPAINRFLLIWRVCALTSLIVLGGWLARRWRGAGMSAAFVALVAVADYQTLAYWLTFTPESAFYVIYLPVALVCALRRPQAGTPSVGKWLLLSVLLGFVTTIKLTLWPVTLWIGASLAFTHFSGRQSWSRFVLFVGAAVGTYVLAVSLFAHDRLALWIWMLRLIENGGRYGASRPGGGMFPPLSLALTALARGFALQNYTLLPVGIAVLVLAGRALRTHGPANSTVWTKGFFATFCILGLMFFKHPYQFKYLMPATLLMVIWLAQNVDSGMRVPRAWLLAGIFGLSALNAGLSQKLLYDYTVVRAERVSTRIDSWLALAPHDSLTFSPKLPHPLPALLYALPAASPLRPRFEARFPGVSLTDTAAVDFERVSHRELPPPAGSLHALAFLDAPTLDPRWKLVDALPEDGLYVYLHRQQSDGSPQAARH